MVWKEIVHITIFKGSRVYIFLRCRILSSIANSDSSFCAVKLFQPFLSNPDYSI